MKLVLVVVALVAACGPPAKQAWTNTYQGTGEDAFLLDDDFVCVGDPTYTAVGDTSVRIKNVLGHEDEALAVAAAKTGSYPPGTIIQLNPAEASVKRGAGFSAATGDWEFFTLDIGSGRTVITSRGTTDVKNPLNTCVACHAPAAKQFDFTCFDNDKCTPFPPFVSTKVNPDTDDPRCHPRF
jgi:hypothetical protein